VLSHRLSLPTYVIQAVVGSKDMDPLRTPNPMETPSPCDSEVMVLLSGTDQDLCSRDGDMPNEEAGVGRRSQ